MLWASRALSSDRCEKGESPSRLVHVESTTGDSARNALLVGEKSGQMRVCVLSHSPVWEVGWSMIGPWRGRRLRRRVLPDSAGDVGETAGQVAIERTFESSVAGS